MEHFTRLKKLRKEKINQMSKTASSSEYILDYIVLKSGDTIELSVRVVNGKPWYQVSHNYEWGNSSYYDGDNYEKAFQIYYQLLLTFKSITEAENFIKSTPVLLEKVKKFFNTENRIRFQEYHNVIQKSPKFLGITDF